MLAKLQILMLCLAVSLSPIFSQSSNAAPMAHPTLGEASNSAPYIYYVSDLNGTPITLVASPIRQNQESEVVRTLAKGNLKNTTFFIKNENDPALQSFDNSLERRNANLYYIAPLENLPLLNESSIDSNQKSKFIDKLKEISTYCKHEKTGLLWSIFYGSAVGGFTWYSSSSIPAGISVMAAVSMWSMFISTKTHKWERLLSKGASALTGAFEKVSSLFGRKLSSTEKVFYEVSGKFGVSWATSSAAVGFTFWQAGTLESLLQVLWYGFLANYSIWDAAILKKFKNKQVNRNFVSKYFGFQFFLGTLFEVSSYLQVPITQSLLASTTIAGVMYLAFGENVETQIKQRRQRIPQSTPAHLQHTGCDQALAS